MFIHPYVDESERARSDVSLDLIHPVSTTASFREACIVEAVECSFRHTLVPCEISPNLRGTIHPCPRLRVRVV
jgi:hypothetical protein